MSREPDALELASAELMSTHRIRQCLGDDDFPNIEGISEHDAPEKAQDDKPYRDD